MQPLRTEGLVLGLRGTCHCSAEQTRLCHWCDSMLFPAGSAGSDLRHTGWCGTREISPAQPCPEQRLCHELRMNGWLPCQSGGVLCSVFLHPHHTAQELFVLLLISTRAQHCGNSSLSRLHINCAEQQMGFSSLLRKANLFICSSVLLLN